MKDREMEKEREDEWIQGGRKKGRELQLNDSMSLKCVTVSILYV